MENIIATGLGGFLAILGVVAGVYLARRGERQQWNRELQIRIATEALSALQRLVREITTVAYLEETPEGHKMGRFVGPDTETGSRDVLPDVAEKPVDFFAAVTGWNASLHQILVAGIPALAERAQELDHEMDKLLDIALYEQWSREGFREQRRPLGEKMADFVDTVRVTVGLEPLTIENVWAWAD